MGRSPQSVDTKRIARVGAAGAALGVLGIGLFMLVWVVAGSANVDVFPRLVMSVCLPPAIMAGVVGTYLLLIRNRPSNG